MVDSHHAAALGPAVCKRVPPFTLRPSKECVNAPAWEKMAIDHKYPTETRCALMSAAGVLSPLGVAADEEHVYRLLLADPGAGMTELQAHSTLSPARLRRAMTALEAKAMVTRSEEQPASYHPAPPDIVVEALVSAREEELQRTRLAAQELSALLQTPPDQPQVSKVVEVITSPDAIVRRWTQQQRSARRSLEVFVRPPFAQPDLDEDESVQRSLYERGCEVRGVYDQRALQAPDILASLQRTVPLGEQARVATELPVKLALFDRRLAFVPLGRGDSTTTLVVHESAMLDALIALFDLWWHRALPFDNHNGSTPEPSPEPDLEANVIALMRAGLKDDAIARQLGVSTTTVRRRINALALHYGVSTRFQLGIALGQPAVAAE